MIVGESKEIHYIQELIQKTANSSYPVLITGETGVGKELVARKIHELSERRENPFLSVNCSNIPDHLFESELFGYKKGAFTDAFSDKRGLLECADQGSFLFDEFSDLSSYHQSKLLRVLETMEIFRLGEVLACKVNIRFLFATNENISSLIIDKKFRIDLFYRINTLQIIIPPLRNRKEDIPLLVDYFLRMENTRNNGYKRLESAALSRLMDYDYPGNVRELQNIIKKACIFSKTDIIKKEEVSLDNLHIQENDCMLDKLFSKITGDKRSYWEVIHEPFLRRELNKREVAIIIAKGLQSTGGSFIKLLDLFNIENNLKNYKKFMSALRTHQIVNNKEYSRYSRLLRKDAS